ncbi:unnamed protein product [Lactuca saligna]|uniref:ATP-dependent DNA helicase n=1 Tax=Lactuca saligna TaxID=75948 RepID=A0AA35YK11_LACSI|nr:unnamed protein product [Lactuca saligna]
MSSNKRKRSSTSVASTSGHSRRISFPIDVDVLPVYYDCGDCSCVCEFCGALFWFTERVLRYSRVNHPRYTHCCRSGDVVLPNPITPPNVLSRFFEDDSFMRNNEVVNRICAFREDNNVVLSADIVACLSDMLTANNEYVRTFKTAKEISPSMSLDSYAVRLFNTVPDKRYGPPAAGTLGCIVCGDDVGGASYDVVIYSKIGLPQRISKLHPSYMPLMYPLLFLYDEADNTTIPSYSLSEFASWLLDIGNGNIGVPDATDPENTKVIDIPPKFIIDTTKGLQSLIDFVYGSEILANPSPENLSDRAIICPKNETAYKVNAFISLKNTGHQIVYNSSSRIHKTQSN